ncbi:hypothetical protein K2173_021769 [Erythroxylum novogranatense]|uniref:Uncharacterized protein n=1 Tax=Erythroxylum novogranatense TaxID=1862640 RepID=A0AAV8TXT3_9ROSI|nr:hypothetical protein K2173_021769 [Erythroxylum novogranatense]
MVTLASSSLCSTSTSSNSTISCLSSYSSLKLYNKKAKFGVATLIPQLGLDSFPQWDGLKHLGISITPKCIKKEKRHRFKGMVVRASLFGVGAPEALVIGVVALLVFGPKGLAEVARNLGKTLRDFQPAIKELQEVSREFKSTLEKAIGLDEISGELRSTYNSNKRECCPNPFFNCQN